MPDYTKAYLLNEIDSAWSAIQAYIASLSASQLSDIRDPQGWAGKDHLIHLAMWEKGMIYCLEKKQRYEGMGLSREIFLNTDIDTINDTIFQQHKDKSLSTTMAEWQVIHTDLLALLENFTDEELQLPYGHYQAEATGEYAAHPMLARIYGNTAHHYREHQEWIQELLKTS